MPIPARNALGRFTARAGGPRQTRLPSSLGGNALGRALRGTLDSTLLTSRLREYVKASGKSVIEALNKAGRNAAFRAIRKTPKTKIAQITADVGTPASPKDNAYGIYIKKHHLSGAGMVGLHAKVVRMIAVKRSSIAYIAAGFLKALKAFANTVRDVNPRSIAARGYGKRARPDRKYSEIMNAAPGADEMAAGPLAEAAVEALDDMMDHLAKTQTRDSAKFNS